MKKAQIVTVQSIDDVVKDYNDIERYLPTQPSRFKVLITARQNLNLPKPLELKILSATDALELLSQLVGSDKVEQELKSAKELCLRLGYLPLALQLVGQYVKKSQINLTEELRRLEEKGLRDYSLQDSKNGVGVAAVFKLSWEELSQDARKLGCLFSLFALAPIPWNLVKQLKVGLDEENLVNALVNLNDLSLIQRDKYNNATLHTLIRDFFQKQLSELEKCDYLSELEKCDYQSKILKALKNYIENNFPKIENRQEMMRNDVIIPHLQFIENTFIVNNQNCNNLSDDDRANISWILYGLGEYYNSGGLSSRAESYYKKSWNIAQKYCPDLISNLLKLAELDEENQEKYYLEAFKFVEEKNLPKNDKTFAAILNGLAEIDLDNKRFRQAKIKYEQALNIYYSLEPDKDTYNQLYISITFDNLARVYEEENNFPEAFRRHKESLEILNKLLGKDVNNKQILEHKAKCLFHLAEFEIKKTSSVGNKPLAKDEINRYLTEGYNLIKDVWEEKNPKLLKYIMFYIYLCIAIDSKVEVKQKLEEFNNTYNNTYNILTSKEKEQCKKWLEKVYHYLS